MPIASSGFAGLRPLQHPYRDRLFKLNCYSSFLLCYPINANIFTLKNVCELYKFYCNVYGVPANSGLVKYFSRVSENFLHKNANSRVNIDFINDPCSLSLVT